MSLVHQPEMTEKNLAAHRANGAHSQGAVTPEGKARVAAGNLCHRFYAQSQNGALSPRDVKNEATSGDVYENTGDNDNMSS